MHTLLRRAAEPPEPARCYQLSFSHLPVQPLSQARNPAEQPEPARCYQLSLSAAGPAIERIVRVALSRTRRTVHVGSSAHPSFILLGVTNRKVGQVRAAAQGFTGLGRRGRFDELGLVFLLLPPPPGRDPSGQWMRG